MRDIETICDGEAIELFGGLGANVMIGGPPCQGFSVCRRGKGDPKDPRNTLFEEFLRFGRLLDPSLIVMENVPNLVKIKTGDGALVIDIIMRELENLGYHSEWSVLQATDYGIPQIRKRLFIVASKTELASPFPEITHTSDGNDTLFRRGLRQCPTLWDAISDLPTLSAWEGAEAMPYCCPPKNDYQSLLRADSTILYNHKAMAHSKRTVARFAAMSWGDSVSDVPHHLKPRRRNSSEIAQSVYDQNNRRQHPYRPCHTIPASFYANFVHPFADRNFTAREGARLQSFPDSYVFKGKPTVVSRKLLEREGRTSERYLSQYNQIGNAVPPLMAKLVAENLIRQMPCRDKE
jgi:DNA (cytosine-5)-methyltransferase 1